MDLTLIIVCFCCKTGIQNPDNFWQTITAKSRFSRHLQTNWEFIEFPDFSRPVGTLIHFIFHIHIQVHIQAFIHPSFHSFTHSLIQASHPFIHLFILYKGFLILCGFKCIYILTFFIFFFVVM